MYRYSQRIPGTGGGNSKLQQRITRIVLILLIIAVIVLTVIGIQAMAYEGRANQSFKERMRVESNLAYQQANSLSRNQGSDTSNRLGKLRQHIYAIQTLQDIYVSLNGDGARVLSLASFTDIFTLIDAFDNKLSTGSQTTDTLTQLQAAVLEMNNAIAPLTN